MAAATDLSDALRANETMTAHYVELSRQMRAALNIDHLDWCGFAAWSSYTVGAVFGASSQYNLPAGRRRLSRMARKISGPGAVEPMAIGNMQIYVEMALVYKVLLHWWDDHPADYRAQHDLAVVAHELASRASAEMPQFEGLTELSQEQCEYLERGLHAYLRAAQAPAGRQRAELVFVGNCWFSAFEQGRADRWIDEYMYGPTRRMRSRISRKQPRRSDVTRFDRVGSRFFTRFAAVLMTGHGLVALGRPLHHPRPATYLGPGNPLEELRLPETRRVHDTFCGRAARPKARQWPDWDQRMSVIVAYFRRYQHAAAMTAHPKLTAMTERTKPHPDPHTMVLRRYRKVMAQQQLPS